MMVKPAPRLATILCRWLGRLAMPIGEALSAAAGAILHTWRGYGLGVLGEYGGETSERAEADDGSCSNGSKKRRQEEDIHKWPLALLKQNRVEVPTC